MSRRLTRSFSIPILALLAAILVAGAVGAGAYAVLSDGGGASASPTGPSSVRPAAQTSTTALSVNDIYRRVSPGVVEITTTTGSTNSSPYPFGGSGSQQAQGSGFVYDAAGHIVTNEHVVEGAQSIAIRFPNGSSYKATLVGSDASTDIAVLKVDAPQKVLHPLTLADSNDLEVGDGVVAIGSPFGLENTVTSGIVSALHRDIEAPNDFTIDDAIQTDAAINHGNSGGPLLDLLGHVIGVTAQIKSSSGGSEGVGFAIPSDTVRSVASKLISTGTVEHAYLGVAVQTIPSDAAAALGVPAGAEVTEVRPGTPAAQAGLQAASGSKTVNGVTYPTGGDVVTEVDGKPVTSADDLRHAIDAKQPGDQITVTYVRNGAEKTVQVTLAKRPS
jgi:S1-C subfamily serine protease